jgi:HSP20 family protein
MSDQSEKPAGADRKGWAAHSPRLAHALHALHHDVNQLFGRFLPVSPVQAPTGASHLAWLDFGFPALAADVTEDDSALRIAVELPGVAESEIELSVCDSTLTVKGEKKGTTDEKNKTVHIFERSYGAFERSFHLPQSVDRENIVAKLDKGVLVITLPKIATATPRPSKIAIRIG